MPVGVAALIGGALLWGGMGAHRVAAQQGTVASAKDVVVSGRHVGEVDLYGKPVLRIRTASGGFSAAERAQKVAARLNDLGSRNQLGDFRAGFMNGEVVLMSKGQAVITASHESAMDNGSTPTQLAQSWAANFRGAMTKGYAYSGSRPYASPPSPASDEHNADKLVPILSVGTGARVGVALVTGPSPRVAEAVAVAQIEGRYKNIVEGRALVPVSSPLVDKGLQRVPEVSVYAVGNYRLP